MNKLYCGSCFRSTNYESAPPIFCSYCGKPYSESFKETVANTIVIDKPNNLSKSKGNENKYKPQVIIENEEDNINVPHVNKLEVEIEGNLRPNTEKFDKIVASGPLGISRPKLKGKAKKKSKEQIYKEWQEPFKKNNIRESLEVGGE